MDTVSYDVAMLVCLLVLFVMDVMFYVVYVREVVRREECAGAEISSFGQSIKLTGLYRLLVWSIPLCVQLKELYG